MSNQPIHVLLVASNNPVSDWLVSKLRSEPGIVLVGWNPTLEKAAETIAQRTIDVLLLDASVPDAKQVERLQALAANPMNPAPILLVDPTDLAFVQQAILAGARGFLLKPFTETQLVDSLRQAFGVVTQQRQAVGAALADSMPRAESAQILALYSPKGGVGRTSLATSLSVALYQEYRRPVVLVDGDLQFGDVDIAVNAIARTSVADLLTYVNELEPSLVESALIEHSSGIRLLLAPPYFDPSLEIHEGRRAHIVKLLASLQTGYVVVDAPSGLGESTLNLLDVADRVLIVTEPSLTSLRATKRFLELAVKLGFPQEKTVLVLNGHRKDADIPIEDIERHLGCPVAAVVPSDPLAVALALNQGQPIVLRDRNHAVSKAIIKLARQLGGEPAGGMARKVEPSPAPAPQDKAPSVSPRARLLRPGHALGT